MSFPYSESEENGAKITRVARGTQGLYCLRTLCNNLWGKQNKHSQGKTRDPGVWDICELWDNEDVSKATGHVLSGASLMATI